MCENLINSLSHTHRKNHTQTSTHTHTNSSYTHTQTAHAHTHTISHSNSKCYKVAISVHKIATKSQIKKLFYAAFSGTRFPNFPSLYFPHNLIIIFYKMWHLFCSGNLFLNFCQHFCFGLVSYENCVGKVSAVDFGLYKHWTETINGRR